MAGAAGEPPPDQPPQEQQRPFEQPTFMQPFGEQTLDVLDRLCEVTEVEEEVEVEEVEVEEELSVQLPVVVVANGLTSERTW